ncbi:T9SS type A sorting domain-containing protein [Chryseobacterium sp. Leaf394]|uniref:T9SS type A sorting domain-containing protein n=1 Tax=Chryseobacterium sp. Leaf394 TaxID=1736361 RepID=UPI0006FA9895|nr:T9SS type A sorting domain-containing protein [Chryseobacterium sp. Leaf394]KQS91786.1 hypothetical protein ASG21_04825 [Chryseobacterium sp. Leaf394]
MKKFYFKFKKKVTQALTLAALSTGILSNAQSTLAAGDIAFTSYDASPQAGVGDGFSFVALAPIAAGTIISFTDQGYNGSGWQPAGSTESSITWTSSAPIVAGTEVHILGLSSYTYNLQTNTSTVNGSVTRTDGTTNNGLSMSNVGDQLIAYQGGGGSISGAGVTLLAGINFFYTGTTTAAGWNVGSPFPNPNASLMPPNLAAGGSAFFTGALTGTTSASAGKFNCTGTPSTTVAGIRSAVTNSANWTLSATSAGLYSGCNFLSSNPVITTNPVNTTKCVGASATFSIAASLTTSYQWYQNSGTGFVALTNNTMYSGALTNTLTINGITAGMNGYLYRCIATNSSGSATSNSASLTITNVSGSTVVTNVACNGGSNGAINLTASGGVAPYTFNWGGGITTEDRTGLGAGNYSVIITDAGGCTGTVNVTVTQPSSAVAGSTVITNVSCNGGANGAINLTPTGGTAPYTFNWGSGITTEDRTGLSAGVYAVVITDNYGCVTVVNATVTQPQSPVSGTTVVTNVSCNGGSNGSINLTPAGGTGPYTFNWGAGVTTEDRTGLTSGSYSVIITDSKGCTGTVNVSITQPLVVSGTTIVTNVLCNGGSNGGINLTPTGGTAPYTFNWGGGITTEDRTGLTAGNYSVTVIDVNGCTGTVNVNVTQPSAVSGTTVVTNVSCNGGSNGAVNLTPTGGLAPYTFNWGTGVTTEDRTGLGAGSYSVIITDNNGCTGTVNVTVTQPSTVSGTTIVTNVLCNGGSNGTINLTPTGGTAPYTFNWGAGVTTEDRTGLGAGNYSVIITDSKGCTGTVNVSITQPSAVSGTAVVTNVSCNGGSNGAINLTPSGGTAPYTFNWGGGVATEDRTGLTAGAYSVTITDSNGCTGTVTVSVLQPTSAVSGSTVVTNVACNGGSNGAINLTPIGGTAPYTFNWGNGIATEDRTGLVPGNYIVIITDFNGCTATVSSTVTQPNAVAAPTGAAVQSFTAGGSLSTLVVNGQNVKWYGSSSDASAHTGNLPAATLIVNNTTYYATQTINGCESTASLPVLAFNASLNVSDYVKNISEMQIYPNPVQDILNITGDDKILRMIIFSADGRKTIESEPSHGERSINVSNLVQGSYIIQIFTRDKSQTLKFIKK